MAFTIKQFNDLRGILFLMLMTIPSIATTNIDCNGKPFHCVNSTHFMICVDLGGGVSRTIDSFIIPCPAPTECHNTNRFECEFPATTTQQPTKEPVVITTDPTSTTTVQVNELTVQFGPEITTVPIEDLYNTVSTTTLSGSEQSTPNPTFITDSTTIDVFDNVNVSTSGSHADLEVGGKNTEVLNVTATLNVFSETTVFPVITDSPVASTTDSAIIFTQTESNINTVNLDVVITTTEENTRPTFSTTETVNLITENKIELVINSTSENQPVTDKVNVTSSIQSQAAYTTESQRNATQVENNDASITEISLDQSIIANSQDQLRTNTTKEIPVTDRNPLENVLINTENTTTTLNDVSTDYADAVTKQTTQIYATTETLIASSIILDDLSVPTETITLVEPNTDIENKFLVDQEKTLVSVDRGTIEKTPRLKTKTNTGISTQDATADYNLDNVATTIFNDSEVITGPSSEFHNVVISSTAPTIDTTLIPETTITQDTFYSIKTTSEISTSDANVMTDIVITHDNNNNLFDKITTVSLPSTDSSTLTTDEPTFPTAPTIDTTLFAKATITQDAFNSIKTTSEMSTSEANVMTDIVVAHDNNNNLFDNITVVSLSSTDSPTSTTDEKIVRTEPTNYEYNVQNEIVVHSMETNLKPVSDNSLTLGLPGKKIEFNPSVTKPAVSEINTDFVSDVVTQPSQRKNDPALQQLEVSNQPDSDTNVYNLNSKHNIISNLDLNVNKQDIKTETIITEPTFTETEKNTGSKDVNTRIHIVEHYTIIPQPENEKPKIKTIHTTESSNDIITDSNIIFESSSIPLLPTESFLYLEARTPEKATKDQVIIESTTAGNNQFNSHNFNNIDSITDAGSSILFTEATVPYYDVTESIRKADHFLLEAYTTEKATKSPVVVESGDKQFNSKNINNIDLITNLESSILPTEATAQFHDVTELIRKADPETNTIIDTTNSKTPDFNLDKIISELRKIVPTGHEIPSTVQNEPTKTQLKDRVEINTLEKIATGPVHYSPSVAAGTESTIFDTEQFKIKPTSSENQLILETTESILKLNPTLIDSDVSESNLLFESSVNDQLPKALLTKSIDIINIHNLNAPEIGSEKSNKVEAKVYETPMTGTQTHLREIEFNTKQKETKTISGIERNIAEYDTISKLSVTESTRNGVDFNVPSQTIPSDSILQLTTSSVLEKTEENISASKVFDSTDSTKSTIRNSPGFIKTKNEDLISRRISTISNIDNNVQDQAFQTMTSPRNPIQIPNVNLLETIQYNQNIKFSEGLTTLQTPIELLTTESKFRIQNNFENKNENSQNEAQNNKNTVVIILDSSVPINSNKLSSKTENVNQPNIQEISEPILEKDVINLTPSSLKEKVPEGIYVTTHNTAFINNEVQQTALSESVNNNKKDDKGTTNNGLPLPEFSSIGDLSIQNTYIHKHVIIKQESPHVKETVLKELNNAVVNEEKRTSSVNIINRTSTGYNDTRVIIPAVFVTGNELINKTFGEFDNKTITDNSSNFVRFNESDISALALTVENLNKKVTVRNDTVFSEAEIQIPNKIEGHNIVQLDKTAPIQTSDILKIVPVIVDKTFTRVPLTFDSKKDQSLNSEAIFSATETLKFLETVSGDNNVSKFSKTEKSNGTENTHSSIVSSKDVYQKNVKKAPEARVKSLAERDVLPTSNKLSTNQVVSSVSQKVYNITGEAINLAPFDLLSSAKSGGFEEKNSQPSTEKPDDEETSASGKELQVENSNINKDSSFTTLSSESVSLTTESVEVDNKGNNNNNIVQSNNKYETLTSKPTIEISTRPTQVDNLKNIQQLPVVSEVSTQSTVRSTSQKLSLENNTPLPATTKAVTTDFVCKFNQRGRFADKHDCRKFYICHGTPQPLEGICPVYTVFSELRKQCTKNLSHCVRNNQFQCVSEGRFSDFLNDSIYYICAKNKLSNFIRFKLRCQNGYHLNKTSVRCVLNTESSQSISSDISKSNSEQSAALKLEVKSKDSSNNKNKFECKKEGTLADPDSCRVYYVCKKTSKSGYLRKKKKCDSDEYFHKDKKKCVDAESYECK